jgi:hypothetical protein
MELIAEITILPAAIQSLIVQTQREASYFLIFLLKSILKLFLIFHL